jgi:hypothetical protein
LPPPPPGLRDLPADAANDAQQSDDGEYRDHDDDDEQPTEECAPPAQGRRRSAAFGRGIPFAVRLSNLTPGTVFRTHVPVGKASDDACISLASAAGGAGEASADRVCGLAAFAEALPGAAPVSAPPPRHCEPGHRGEADAITSVLILLYALGAILETLGIGMVVTEVRADSRQAEELAERDLPTPVARPTGQAEQAVNQVARANAVAHKDTREAVLHALAGNHHRRWGSVILLIAGILVSLSANLASTVR